MLPKNEYVTLMRTIVSHHLPDEEIIFDLEGESIIDDLYAGKSVQTNVQGATFRGTSVDTVKQIAEAIPLIVATFQLLKAIAQPIAEKYKIKSQTEKGEDTNKDADIAAQWEKRLIDAGLSKTTAQKISKDFAKDIVQFIGG